jgi:hypothetical protein
MPIKAISGTFCAHSHCQYLVFLIEIGNGRTGRLASRLRSQMDVGVPRADVKLLGREIKTIIASCLGMIVKIGLCSVTSPCR